MTTQQRAQVGGEFGANGEWYEGGKFIATKDNPKAAPMERVVSAADAEKRAASLRRAQCVQEWLTSRRVQFAREIATLTAQPEDFSWSPEAWARRVSEHAAGFIPSLGRTLEQQGCLSSRQAAIAVRHLIGRRTKRNATSFDALFTALCDECDV